jgi:hypothetical protein
VQTIPPYSKCVYTPIRLLLAAALLLIPMGAAHAGDETSRVDDSMLNPNAYEAQRAETDTSARLGLFAGSRSFRMGRENPVTNVEGGASFRFFENLFLTGSYRLLDYRLKVDSIDIENAGPLFSVRLRF